MSSRHIAYFLASVSVIATVTANAFAQEAQPDAPPTEAQAAGRLQTILVTAQKREESINDVPLSVSALSDDDIRDRGLESTADLTRLVAGFNYADTGVNAPVYSMRGVGYFDYSLAAAPAVSVYVDEIGLPYSAMTQGASLDLQRVEVLRGPQGTLFGQNATGGLVNYIANKPTEEFEAGLTLGVGSFNRTEAEGYVSGAITNTLRARLALETNRMDDWQKSYTRSDTTGGKNYSGGRFLLDWDITPALTAHFNLNGYIDKSDPQATQVIAITPLTPARLRPEVASYPLAPLDAQAADWSDTVSPSRNDGFWQASGRFDWQLSDTMTLSSITAYSKLDTDDYIDRDGMSNDNSQYALNGKITSFWEELRLAGEAGMLKYVVGATYQDTSTQEFQRVNIESASNVQSTFGVKFSDASNRILNEITSYAFFASGDWRLRDDLTLTTGLRYTQSELDFKGCAALEEAAGIQALSNVSAFFRNLQGLPPAAFVPDNGCSTLGTDFLAVEPHKTLDEDNVSWRLALNWDVTDDVMLYASASRGFKAGNSITVAGSSTVQYDPVKQEKLTSYETGFKAGLLDGNMQLNGAVYYYDYEDKQSRSKILDPVFGPLQALVNIPEAHAYGGELETQWSPVEGLTLNAGVAYLNTEIDEFVGFDALGAQRDFAGNSFSFAPELQVNFDGEYEWPISDVMSGFVGGGASYKSESSADFESDPLFDIDAYTLVDLRAGVRSDNGWRLTFWGKNVTDEYYWNSAIRVQDTVVRVTGMPRTYGMTLGLDF